MKNTLHALSGFSLLFSSVCSSQGATVVSNLDEATNGTQNIADPQAIRFTTGPGPGWIIDAINVRMTKADSTSEILTVTINEEDRGFPATTNSGLGLQSVSSTGTIDLAFTQISLASGDPATLAPNTPYWLVFGGPSGAGGPASTASWAFTNSADETGWSIDQQRIQELNGPGTGWSLTDPGTNSAYLFSIEASPIPEPSSLSLLGLCGVALLRRRR
jgi:hypothetical protein